MHPTLGDFVSRQFYPPEEQFGTGRPPEDFEHELPGYEGRTAAWLDVPAASGYEQEGQSKSRRAEAIALAAELDRLIRHPAASGMTFGVITFYSAQEAAICRELARHGLMIPGDREEYQISDEYREGERLRVGTVDAFQGKEFDVVFLSMVRCNRLRDDTEQERRRKYGHLMSPNRLCVSMSRQQRLLIVAGDAGMLRFPHARDAIRPLVEFHKLAEYERRSTRREVRHEAR
jgi:superfamily I DNA and/or RNA helicase